MYGGFPLVPYKVFIKNQASSASLYDLRKNVNKLLGIIDVEKQDGEK